MIDFERFLNGDIAIEVQNNEEAQKLLDACIANNVDCFGVSAKDYEHHKYWFTFKIPNDFVYTHSLDYSNDYYDVIHETYAVMTFDRFAEEYSIEE